MPHLKISHQYIFTLVALALTVNLFAEEILHSPAIAAPITITSEQHLHKESNEIEHELKAYTRTHEQKRFTFANKKRDKIKLHRVNSGESIWKIAKHYKLSPKLLLQHNPEIKHRYLYIGEKIIIPTNNASPIHNQKKTPKGKYYYVKKGDTLYSIAKNNKVSIKYILKINKILPQIPIEIGQRLLLGKSKKNIPKGYKHEKIFVWPLKGLITSHFGRRANPFMRNRTSYHKGIDIGAKLGHPFKASSGGVVIRAKRMGGYGNCIFILHSNEFISVYAHNKKNLVKKGQIVKKGDVIGLVGRTGSATGPHLHFEIRKKLKKAINPLYAFKIQKLVKVKKSMTNRN